MIKDRRPTILALCIVSPIISVTAVLLRFEARRINHVRLGADDWTVLFALVGHSTSSWRGAGVLMIV